MKIDRATMEKAAPHIKRGLRCLEMLNSFVSNKEHYRLDQRVDVYYNGLAESVLALQAILVSDAEYTKKSVVAMRRANRGRAYTHQILGNDKGEVFYETRAVMPLRRAKRNIIFVDKERKDVYEIRNPKAAKQRAAE